MSRMPRAVFIVRLSGDLMSTIVCRVYFLAFAVDVGAA